MDAVIEMLRPHFGVAMQHLMIERVDFPSGDFHEESYLGDSQPHFSIEQLRVRVAGVVLPSGIVGHGFELEVADLFRRHRATVRFPPMHSVYDRVEPHTRFEMDMHIERPLHAQSPVPLATAAAPELVEQVRDGNLTEDEAGAAMRVLERVDDGAPSQASGSGLAQMCAQMGVVREPGESDLSLRARMSEHLAGLRVNPVRR